MFLKWLWNRKENTSEPVPTENVYNPIGIEEIIYTTVRNRLWKYYDEKLNVNNTYTMMAEIWEEYQKWYDKAPDNKAAIDGLVSICERYEAKMREGTLASIKEYGK